MAEETDLRSPLRQAPPPRTGDNYRGERTQQTTRTYGVSVLLVSDFSQMHAIGSTKAYIKTFSAVNLSNVVRRKPGNSPTRYCTAVPGMREEHRQGD